VPAGAPHVHPQGIASRLRQKHLGTWMPAYLRQLCRPRWPTTTPARRHLLFAFCDHFEPLWGGASSDTGYARVKTWEEQYPAMAAEFRDADGRAPRHSFFFPGEQYEPRFLESLGRLVRAGLGEVELHLHHDQDTAENLRRDLAQYVAAYASRAPDARPGGPTPIRLHSWQLVPGERSEGRALVWRQCRTAPAVRQRLLRRLHLPFGARRMPAVDHQPDLLARGRPRKGARL